MRSLTQQLSLRMPIVLAPMAGGVGTPELVAAVSNAGGLGSLGAGYLTPAQIQEAGAAVRRLTREPFAVNLFALQPTVKPAQPDIQRAISEIAPFHAALNLPPPTLPLQVSEDFEAQSEAVLEARPRVLSFAFGRLEARHLAAARSRGVLSIGTATGLEEARQLEADGVDAAVLQGSAAGGHRGGWLIDELADTLTLIRAVAQVLHVPLIAAGGLMTAADVRAVLEAGASLAQCGMAFLRAAEAGTVRAVPGSAGSGGGGRHRADPRLQRTDGAGAEKCRDAKRRAATLLSVSKCPDPPDAGGGGGCGPRGRAESVGR